MLTILETILPLLEQHRELIGRELGGQVIAGATQGGYSLRCRPAQRMS
jgi:hypothetical protein